MSFLGEIRIGVTAPLDQTKRTALLVHVRFHLIVFVNEDAERCRIGFQGGGRSRVRQGGTLLTLCHLAGLGHTLAARKPLFISVETPSDNSGILRAARIRSVRGWQLGPA